MSSISKMGQISYPKELVPAIEKLSGRPDMSALLNNIGPINIKVIDCEGFPARWTLDDKRVLKLDPSLLDTEVDLIASLVFELFNAFQSEALKRAVDTNPDVEDLVCAIEKIEHSSARLTQAAMNRMYGAGVEHDFSFVSADFNVHYALNQVSGHSELLARTFRSDQEYQGSLAHPLSDLDKTARDLICKLIQIKEQVAQPKVQGNKLDYESVTYALRMKSSENPTYQKVLDCMQKLFPERTTFKCDQKALKIN